MNLTAQARADMMTYNAAVKPQASAHRDIIIETWIAPEPAIPTDEITTMLSESNPAITLCGAIDCPHHGREWVTADEARSRTRQWMEAQHEPIDM